jgi:hypothetical protein
MTVKGGLMLSLSAEVRKLLSSTKLMILPEDYYVIHLPADTKEIPSEWYRPATTRFAVFIREPNEITLIVTRRKWLRMKNIFPKYEKSIPMKIVTFDQKLARASGSYTAIGTVLAEAKLTGAPISSYSCDHLLVPKTSLPRTMRVLRGFLESCKKR